MELVRIYLEAGRALTGLLLVTRAPLYGESAFELP